MFILSFFSKHLLRAYSLLGPLTKLRMWGVRHVLMVYVRRRVEDEPKCRQHTNI